MEHSDFHQKNIQEELSNILHYNGNHNNNTNNVIKIYFTDILSM